jgi:hypothetical protein
MKRLILSAALATLPMITHAAPVTTQDACEMVDSEQFLDMGAAFVKVVDVGPVTKIGGVNQCAVVMDTSVGRVRIVFTTQPSLKGGDTMIRKINETNVRY